MIVRSDPNDNNEWCFETVHFLVWSKNQKPRELLLLATCFTQTLINKTSKTH